MTFTQPYQGQPSPLPWAMSYDSFISIRAASWNKPTSWSQKRGKPLLIK